MIYKKDSFPSTIKEELTSRRKVEKQDRVTKKKGREAGSVLVHMIESAS